MHEKINKKDKKRNGGC